MKVNEDGSFEVAKDTEGKEYIATTDENGHYEFNVYNKGKYFVEMIRPDNYKTTKNVEDSDKGNHMTDQYKDDQYTYSSSKEFNLNKNHKDQIVNGGWHKNLKEISLEIPIAKILGLPKVNTDEMRETLSYLVNDAPKEWTFNFKIEALSENKEVEKEEQKSFTIENQLKQFAENKEHLYKMISKMMDRDIKSLDELSDEEVEILYNIARSILSGSAKEEFLEYTYEVPEGEAREFTFRITELPSNYKLVKNDRYEERYHYFKYDGQNEYNIYHTFNTNYEDRKELTEELLKKIWETNLGEDFYNYRMSMINAEEYYISKLDRNDYIGIYYGLGGDSVRVYYVYPFINSILKQPWSPMEPPVREIKVKKEFKASNGESIKSPVDEIEVELYKNGQPTGNKLTLSKGNNWAGKFENLPVYESLEKTEAFAYTVKEIGEENRVIKLTDKSFDVSYSGNMKDGFTITNKEEPTIPPTPLNPPKEDIKVEKIWQDKDGKEIAAPVEKVEVELYRDGKATDKKLILNAENNWTGEFKDLDVVEKLDSEKVYKYSVKEVGEEKGKVVIGNNKYEVKYSGSMEDGFTITNKEEPTIPPTPLNPPKEDIKVEKIWQDKDGKEITAPVDKIEVELYRDGKSTGKKLELNKANKWSGEFKDLDVVEKLDSEKAYEYSVKEVGEEKGKVAIGNNKYEVKYSGSMKDGFTITNEEEPTIPPTPLDPPKTDIKVEKIWQGKDGKEISAPVDKIEVELYRDGKATGKKLELNKANKWSGEFKDLDVVEKLDSEKAYEYSVKEVEEEKGKVVIGNNKYKVKYIGSMKDGFTITNKEEPTIPPTPLDPQKEDIKVEKIWQDKDGKEISAPVDKIEVELYRDGKSTGKKLELNKANNWSGEFKDLDVVEKLDSKEAYKYSVKEVGEETGSIKLNGNWYKVNYSGSMKDGFTITNKEEPKTPPTPPTPSEPDTITIKVKKDWTLYGNKPVDKILVELYRDGEATGKILELNRDNNWSGEFKNLDVKKGTHSTHDYHYTIKEIGEVGNTIKLDGRWFDVNYLGNMKDGFTIVNKEEKPKEPGKPEEPNTPNKPNDPQEPNTPETPKEPEKPNNPGKPVKPNTPKTPLPGKPLPKTGNGLNPSTYAWILLGLGNLSTFAGIQRKKRIKSRRNKNDK